MTARYRIFFGRLIGRDKVAAAERGKKVVPGEADEEAG